MDQVLYLLTLTLVQVLFTTARTFTCDPDVYPASHRGDFVVTCTVITEAPIESIDYTYKYMHSGGISYINVWTYNNDHRVEHFPYLVIDAEDLVANSTSHQFTVTMNRCAADEDQEVGMRATVATKYAYIISPKTIATFDEVPGRLSMTVDDDVVSCGDDVIVKNTSPTISCTVTEAYPEPTLTLLHDGHNMTQTDGGMLNNDKCLYNHTTHSETHITNGHKHIITCMSGNQICNITLERECDDGTYGVNCTEVCSSHCRECHRMLGCSGGCTDGYTKEFCTIAPKGNIENSDIYDDGGSLVWLIVAISVVGVGVIAAAATVLLIYCYKKKIHASTTPDADLKITDRDTVKLEEAYTYIGGDGGAKNVAYTLSTADIIGVYLKPTNIKDKSDYKADDQSGKADDKNKNQQSSAAATHDQNSPLGYENVSPPGYENVSPPGYENVSPLGHDNVEFDNNNYDSEGYMIPISTSLID